MQITFSPEQIDYARKVFEFVVWPVAGWISRTAFKQGIRMLNDIITDNTNRIKDELKVYIDKRFQEHERDWCTGHKLVIEEAKRNG